MGYFDLQVNGYGGVDFNQDDLSPEALNYACKMLRSDGVERILATIITEQPQLMCKRLKRIVDCCNSDAETRNMICGIHIEGPFISDASGYHGAHPSDSITPANVELMKSLLEAAGGMTRLVTLAPERDQNLKTIRYLVKEKIVVSAGHCNPDLDQLTAAVDAGLSMFTHLGNGCPGMLPRHDNIIQRVLALRDRLWLCFIADGVHVPFFALATLLQLAGDRAIVVTDAMAAAGLGPGSYRLGRWDVEVGPDLAVRAPDRSHLLGSAGTMRQAEENLRTRLRLTDGEVRQLTKTRAIAALNGHHSKEPAKLEVVIARLNNTGASADNGPRRKAVR